MSANAHPGVPSDRGRRLEHQERAYRLQVRGGVEGAVKYTVYGTLLVTLGHLTWPLFRRQTLALKGFIVSSAAVTGLVINADNYLLRFESHQRLTENELRRQARNELAGRGIIATEGEIRKWKARRETAERETQATATTATVTPTATPTTTPTATPTTEDGKEK